RWPRDWSSDVCSSDLTTSAVVGEAVFVVCSRVASQRLPPLVVATAISALGFAMFLPAALLEMRAFPLSRLALADWALVGYYGVRSEERRVGKECVYGG